MDKEEIAKLVEEWKPRIAEEEKLAGQKRGVLKLELARYERLAKVGHPKREAVAHKVMEVAQELWSIERQIWHIERFLENLTGGVDGGNEG